MKFNKIISLLLAVLMLMSTFSISAFAEEAAGKPVYEYNTSEMQPVEYFTGKVIDRIETDKKTGETKIYYKEDEHGNELVIKTPEDKLETMDLRLVRDGYELYVDAYSGEVATRCIATGEILFTNPYNIADAKKTSDAIKAQLFSQLAVSFTTITTDEQETYHSYTWAAQREQIEVKNIKNGIRVEYSIGREQTKMLLPMLIEKSSFDKNILEPLKAGFGENDELLRYDKLMVYYVAKSDIPNDELNELYKEYPKLKEMDFYKAEFKNDNEKLRTEDWIKTFAPDYTYEDLDEDHLNVGYESKDDNPPLFKMALEYTLDSKGVSVRLPANGIRFNESLYRLDNIEVLPYMGAAACSEALADGKNADSGYTFFPDGSGTLFDFEQVRVGRTTYNVTGKVYGEDFAYHSLSSTHQEIIRYPVFGLVTDETLKKDVVNENGDIQQQLYKKERGFFAIVEEGDAMMELCSSHEINAHDYNTVKMKIYPRPQDEYNMADAISVGTNQVWTVVSSRKYTGVYKVRYIMLASEQTLADKKLNANEYYDTSYFGMACAYRDYLTEKGILTKLTAEDVKADIPLYIETFGAMWTTERFLSIPVDVLTPLTSFEDIKTMYNDFAAEGITNINFIMTGYANGGMFPTAPYKLDWENAVGGDKGFEELIAYAREKGFGLFPDFDFAFVSSTGNFDGFNMKKHVVKTIDNRYTSKREYSATKQTHISFFELAVSPAYFSHFYTKLTENYLDYNPMGISVSSLGSYLNSDFDEDEPYNREDGKEYTVEAFKYFDENYDKVMTSGGNAFTWKYVDFITDIALDSSRYARAAASVPFLGIVLHGSIQMAGAPINMEGNMDYALLKAIENGAGLNFVLSYRNTENLKENEVLSKYYSVRYDIWFDDAVALYKELNSLLAGVQTSFITEHAFINTGSFRVPDIDELDADAKKEMQDAIDKENAMVEAQREVDRILLRDSLITVKSFAASADARVANIIARFDEYNTTYSVANLQAFVSDYQTALGTNNANEIKVATDELETFMINAIQEGNSLIESLASLMNEFKNHMRAYELLAASGELDADAAKASEYYAYSQTIANAFATLTAKNIEANVVNHLSVALWDEVKDIEELEFERYTVEEEVIENVVASDEKYVADDNKVVFVKYENGTSFLLNFNSYDVRVNYNGVWHMIKSYGYVVLSMAN